MKTNLTLDMQLHNSKKKPPLSQLPDGTWFLYDDVVYIINQTRDVLAFSICGNYALDALNDTTEYFLIENVTVSLSN